MVIAVPCDDERSPNLPIGKRAWPSVFLAKDLGAILAQDDVYFPIVRIYISKKFSTMTASSEGYTEFNSLLSF